MNILVVEDEQAIANNILTILKLYNHSCLHCSNGQEAIDYLQNAENLPKLIFSDVMMPIVDGFEFLNFVKNNESTKNIPFCLLSARADVVDINFGLNRGADAYLTKPFTAKELIKTTEMCLALK
jgi:DNA-binding response OmpR family regulator